MAKHTQKLQESITWAQRSKASNMISNEVLEDGQKNLENHRQKTVFLE